MRSLRLPVTVVLLAVLALAPTGLRAQSAEPARRTVVAREDYAAGGTRRLLFGGDYRDLWTTPIEVEVLDLERTAGGLTPERTIGHNQTLGLALRGADGNSYTFRSLDKDPTPILPDELLGTPIADMAQDQISSNLPGSALVVAPIMRAAGVHESVERLMVMPDDERLGEFREEFAGMLGTFYMYPVAGTWGSTELIAGTELVERLTANPAEAIDAPVFLRARLIDLLLGDWDRHLGQYRWARFPDQPRWQPIAEDRDNAFSRFDGLAMGFHRNRDPKFDQFGSRYQGLEGLTWNGRSVDRRLLTGLSRDQWREVAADLQRRLSDEVLEEAVRALPEAWYELAGARLLERLRTRRDGLLMQAERFYEFLAADVNVWGTDAPELFTIERLEGGQVEVAVAAITAADAAGCAPQVAEPHYRRRFRPDETEQVRVYTGTGDDRVAVRGAGGGVAVKIIGDAGSNLLCVEGSAPQAFDLATHGRSGRGPEVAERVWLAPSQPLREAGTPIDEQGAPKDARRDWGSTTYTTPWFGAGPDIGLLIGMGWTKETFGFRRHPYGAQHTIRLGFSTGARRPKLEYTGIYHLENRRPYFQTRALVSGIETLNFFGIGNETGESDEGDFEHARREAVEVGGAYVLPLGDTVSVFSGPVARFSSTRRDEDDLRLVNVLQPYGVEDIFQVGWTAGVRFNEREPVRVTELKETDDPARFGWPELGRGFTLDLDAAYYPDLLDLREDYVVLGGAAAYTTGTNEGGPAVGLRVGGQTNRGEAPYYDLAIVGEEQIRGLPADRFSGSSSVYGNVLVAVPLGEMSVVIPGRWGLLARGGTGRVFVGEEDSSRWHWGVGGGFWWTPWDYSTAVRVTVAGSDAGVRAYLRLGFGF